MSSRNIASLPLAEDLTFANSAALYAPGMQVGAVATLRIPQAFQSGDRGPILIFQSLAGVDLDAQNQAYDLLFFRTPPAGVGDHVAFTLSPAEAADFIGRIKVLSTDYQTYGTKGLASVAAIAESMKLGTATPQQLAVVMVNQGAPTYTAPSRVSVKLSGIIT